MALLPNWGGGFKHLVFSCAKRDLYSVPDRPPRPSPQQRQSGERQSFAVWWTSYITRKFVDPLEVIKIGLDPWTASAHITPEELNLICSEAVWAPGEAGRDQEIELERAARHSLRLGDVVSMENYRLPAQLPSPAGCAAVTYDEKQLFFDPHTQMWMPLRRVSPMSLPPPAAPLDDSPTVSVQLARNGE